MTSRTSGVLRILAVLLIAAECFVFVRLHSRFTAPEQPPFVTDDPAIAAVADLSRQRHLMLVAERALRGGDGATARNALLAANFGSRSVELYRRYYLANAEELLGLRSEARATLAVLWATNPRFERRIDVAFHLSALYEEAGDWNAACRVLEQLVREEDTETTREAYQRLRTNLLAAGDVSGLVAAARRLAVRLPSATVGRQAASDLSALGATLDRKERITRVATMAEDGDPAEALGEIAALRRAGTTFHLEKARAEALARQGKREEADRIVAAFVGQNATVDRDLLSASWRWWTAAARTIENRAWRTVQMRVRSGTTRVKVGGRWVDRPTYRTVPRRVKRSLGAADRRRLASVKRTLIERGERLLDLDLDAGSRRDIHRTLAHAEESPRRQAKLEEHIERLVALDPSTDELLQEMWDEGWRAWIRRDLDTARERFAFISRVYQRPDIRRQARYWYARCLEESGEQSEASRHFDALQNTAYEDLYARLASTRVTVDADGQQSRFIHFKDRPDDWVATAEREMPRELRLAWELSLVGLDHDARMEIRGKVTTGNKTWAHSILARIYRAEGSFHLAAHSIRQAWPQIGTVDQDGVPVHFLRMYYPTRFHASIERESANRGLDSSLVKALILQESGYDPEARSGAGATGLMQLMAPTAREMATRIGRDWDEALLVDPDFNIEAGSRYLRLLLREFDGNALLALAAYNGGIGNVKRWLRRELKGSPPDELVERIPFSETRGYVKRVIFYRSVYEHLGVCAVENHPAANVVSAAHIRANLRSVEPLRASDSLESGLALSLSGVSTAQTPGRKVVWPFVLLDSWSMIAKDMGSTSKNLSAFIQWFGESGEPITGRSHRKARSVSHLMRQWTRHRH